MYIEDTKNIIASSTQSIDGIKDYCNVFFDRLLSMNLENGCPVAKLVLEVSDEKEVFRENLTYWYELNESWME